MATIGYSEIKGKPDVPLTSAYPGDDVDLKYEQYVRIIQVGDIGTAPGQLSHPKGALALQVKGGTIKNVKMCAERKNSSSAMVEIAYLGDEDESYGYIISEDEKSVFLHDPVVEENTALETGDRVTFLVTMGNLDYRERKV